MKIDKIPLSYEVLYIGDIIVNLYVIYTYSGFSFHPPIQLVSLSNIIIMFAVVKSLLFFSSSFIHDKFEKKFKIVSLGLVMLYIASAMAYVLLTYSVNTVVPVVTNISPEIYSMVTPYP